MQGQRVQISCCCLSIARRHLPFQTIQKQEAAAGTLVWVLLFVTACPGLDDDGGGGYFEVCLGPGTDPSDSGLFLCNLLIQVRNLASLLHCDWFRKSPNMVI